MTPDDKLLEYQPESSKYHHAIIEKRVWDICKKLGYQIKNINIRRNHISINDFIVAIKMGRNNWHCSKTNKRAYRHFNVMSKYLTNADFIIVYIENQLKFYIIPIKFLHNRQSLYFPLEETKYPERNFNRFPWENFEERWDFLLAKD
jgi:hypothetical protein